MVLLSLQLTLIWYGTAKKAKGYKDQVPWPGVITNGTPFFSAYAYKTKGRGSCLQCGITKKAKGYKDPVPWPGATPSMF